MRWKARGELLNIDGHYWVHVNKHGIRYKTVVEYGYLRFWLQSASQYEVEAWAGPIPYPEGEVPND